MFSCIIYFTLFIFCAKHPYGELFLKIIKVSANFHFVRKKEKLKLLIVAQKSLLLPLQT